jgi:O-acetyl-ADP-ribose deacetylase (regulator of RNase III)
MMSGMIPALTVIRGDITRLAVDAIVNAANASLAGGGGVDGAIHRAAGPRLLAACRAIGGCPTGSAVITPGFALPARFVIHAVGPIWRGGDAGEEDLLRSAVTRAMALAAERGVRSIAFPAISCGIYGYPVDEGTAVIVDAVRTALRAPGLIEDVRFVAFDDDVARGFAAALG